MNFFSFCSTIITSIITSIITYIIISKINQKRKLKNLGYIIPFFLKLQQAELESYKVDIQCRKKYMYEYKNFNGNISRHCLVSIIQNFSPLQKINVDIQKSAEIILTANKNHKEIIHILQKVFISNKKYNECMQILNNFNEFKLLLVDEKDNIEKIIIHFLGENISIYEEYIKEAIIYQKKVFTAFKNILKQTWRININL